jgi:hypothetical protein
LIQTKAELQNKCWVAQRTDHYFVFVQVGWHKGSMHRNCHRPHYWDWGYEDQGTKAVPGESIPANITVRGNIEGAIQIFENGCINENSAVIVSAAEAVEQRKTANEAFLRELREREELKRQLPE